jgi:hypothetical protein
LIMTGILEAWVLLGWAIALPYFLSAWFRRPSSFQNKWRTKGWWMLWTLLGFFPYGGFILSLIYRFKVGRYLPDNPIWAGLKHGAQTPLPQRAPAGEQTEYRGNGRGGCNMCSTGDVDCPHCNWNTPLCGTCHGHRKIPCPFCHGRYRGIIF